MEKLRNGKRKLAEEGNWRIGKRKLALGKMEKEEN